jgi:hypothetical protein
MPVTIPRRDFLTRSGATVIITDTVAAAGRSPGDQDTKQRSWRLPQVSVTLP